MDDIPNKIREAILAVCARRPLVVCLTNTVAANWTANCLLALGATPAMMEEPCEAAELTAQAGALLVNVGTVTSVQAATMRAAIAAARAQRVPWVLDPVAADKLTYRAGLVREFLKSAPALVRGNHGEIDWLVKDCAQTGFAWEKETCVLSTGAVDRVFFPGDRNREEQRLARGDAMLARVTATGCAQGAMAAAFCAVTDSGTAAMAAAYVSAVAGERAAQRATSAGAFQMALLDAFGELVGGPPGGRPLPSAGL